MNTGLRSILILIMLSLAGSAYAQEVGDYRSAVNGGQWVTPATWETWDGSNWVPAVNAPSAPYNVTIRSGFNVVLDNSGKNCKNLTVEAGATFKTNLTLPTSSIRYVRINGSTATINGMFGDSTAGDAIALEAAGVGNTVTVTGTGVFAPARVRMNNGARRATIVFDIDTKFMYTGSSGTGGIALYPQADSGTFVVNAGKTLRFVDQASVAVGSSNGSAADSSGTFNVYGAIDLSRPNSQLTLKVKTGKFAVMNIYNGGSVVVGNKVFASTVADGGTTTMLLDGSLTAGNQVDFSNPNFVVTGTGTFTLSPGGTLLIGHPQGITSSGATGQIQTTVRDFGAGTSYSYVGTAAQVTGDALPPTVLRLVVNDSLGVTLSQTTAVNGILTLTRGALITGTKTMMMMDTGWVARNSGFIDGNLQKRIPAGTNLFVTFELGTGATYSPVVVNFANVSTEGTMVASVKAGKHPRIGGAVDPWHAVNRYWTLSMGGIVFDTYGAEFDFAPADLDPGADTAVFVVARENAGVWSYPSTANRTGTSTSAWTMTQAGEFVIGNPLPASMVVPSNGTGGGVWNDLQTWAWGAVPRHSDSAAVVTGDSVFVEAADSCNTVGVQTGGKLVLDSALAVVNMGVEGTLLKNQGGGLTASGLAAFGKGGYYIHNQAGGSIPSAIWDTNSTCEIRAALGVAPSNGNQNFYNVVWNCPNQSANLNLGWKGNTIGGNITVLATGSGSRWQMMAPQAESTATVTVMGDIIQSGGQFTTNGTSNANTTVIVHHYGNVNVTGGNFSISRGSQGGSGTTRWYLHKGNFSMANATTQNSNANGARFVFLREAGHALTLSSVTFSGGLPIEVDTNTSLDLGNSVIRGSGIFELKNGARITCANLGGLDSALQMTGTKTFGTGLTFRFTGTAPQITGVSVPSQIYSLEDWNDSTLSLSGNVTVDYRVAMFRGRLNLNGKTLTLGPSGRLVELPGHMVMGDSGKITTTFTNPATGQDRGIGVDITSSVNMGSTVINRYTTAQTAGKKGIKRWFEIIPTTNTGLNATVTFWFDSTELNGTNPTALKLHSSTNAGATWTEIGGAFGDSLLGLTLTVTGVNSFSLLTAAEPNVVAPAQVVLVSPASNATIGADSVRCVWQKSTPVVTTYWFERGSDSLFSSSVIDSTITDTTVVTKGLLTNHTYWWRVRAKNVAGWGPFSTARKFTAVFTGVAEGQQVPIEFSLKQNYPNPFNPATTILFTVEKTGRATMDLFNILGQRVQTLFDGVAEPGKMHMVKFDGSHLPSGTYFYRLQSEGKSDVKRLLLLK